MNWPEAAVKVGTACPQEKWHSSVRKWLAKRRRREPWCVALSGGADSLALLLLLWAHWPERRSQLVALHFNHRLRGRAADADEAFCRTVCRALKIKLRVGRWRPPVAKPSEAIARMARHEFFAREMERAATDVLWLAHQQDDIAETMLMRLARGSGSAGLAAPRPVHLVGNGRVHLRPLLTVKKAEIEQMLTAAGAPWREDATNAGGDFLRNRIRHRVVPAWQDVAGRDALAGAALARERLEEDDDALEAWVTELAALRGRKLDLTKLAGKPRAVVRRALHRWLLGLAVPVDLSRQGFELLLAAVEAGRDTRLSLNKHGFAVISRGMLAFVRA